jgi:hypothetical protein
MIDGSPASPVAADPPWLAALSPCLERSDYRMPLKTPIHHLTGRMVSDVAGAFIRLPRWEGEPFVDDFGRKAGAMVALDDEHLLPEIAVLRLLERDGWEGRWVNTVGGKGEVWKFLTRWDDVPRDEQRNRIIEADEPRRVLAKIASRAAKRYAGCWDVYGWRGDEFCFLQVRRGAPKPSDAVADAQIDWLHTALLSGDERVRRDSFGVVSWDFADRG